MTIYQWLCIIGVPAICVGLLGYACRQIKKSRDDDKAVKLWEDMTTWAALGNFALPYMDGGWTAYAVIYYMPN